MNKFALVSVGALFGMTACGAPDGDQASVPSEPVGSAQQGGASEEVRAVQQEAFDGGAVPTASLPERGVVNVLISRGTNYGWGGTQRLSIGSEPGVATIGEDTYTVGTNGSLYVSKADNCFVNDF